MPWQRKLRANSARPSSSVVSIPPSPVVITLVGKNENDPAVPRLPAGRPSSRAPWAWAASSSRGRPRSAQKAAISAASGTTRPPTWTTTTARVRAPT